MSIKKLGLIKDSEKVIFPLVTTRPRTMTFAEYQLLTPEQRQGEIVVTDYPAPEDSDKVEVTADGVKTIAALLNEINDNLDTSKISGSSLLKIGSQVMTIQYDSSSTKNFSVTTIAGNDLITQIAHISNNSNMEQYSNSSGVVTDISSQVRTNGAKFTLYYNSTKTLELGTLAENCMMSDGVTSVESNLNKLNYSPIINTGLSYTNCTYVDGGYSVIGNIVILNIRIKVTEDGHIGISNLPRPKTVNNKSTVGVNVFRIQQDKASQLYAYMMLVNQTTAMIATKDITLTADEEYSFSAMYVSDYAS